MEMMAPVYVGDDDNDGTLDLDETWIYKAKGTALVGPYYSTVGIATNMFNC